MSPPTVPDLVGALRRNDILRPDQLETLINELQGHFSDARSLARELLDRGWLTSFQLNQIFRGKGDSLALGQYVLLNPLGEGGMGQVFTARHRRLDRIDAVKILRRESLRSPQAISRFHSEIETAARLSHPNVVHAYDADEVNGTHFFAMEYVDGIDLARCVKQFGPVPVSTACDYIRQAALGLQHAFERGLVHRDIKPANLLVTRRGGVVKILDMGLARFTHPDPSEQQAGVSHEGTLVGTLDFLSPEQAMNSSQVDIRGDLYSLGCTFYYLLTGQVPFPGGAPLEKLARHRWSEPTSVDRLRPEVSPAIASVVSRLMAKEPSERFQTPAELARTLSQRVAQTVAVPIFAGRPPSRSAPAATQATVATQVPTIVAGVSEDTADDWNAILADSAGQAAGVSASSLKMRRQVEERRVRLVLGISFGVGLVLLLLLVVLVWSLS